MEAIKEIIDRGREYDQAREHDHRGECWCGFGVGSRTASGLRPSVSERTPEPPRPKTQDQRPSAETHIPRAVSPAIWEFRAKQAEADLEKERQENAVLRQNIATLKDRITGFERLSQSLAVAVDRTEKAFRDMTGFDPADFVARFGQKDTDAAA